MPTNKNLAALGAASFVALSLSAPLATAQEVETIDAAAEDNTLRVEPVIVTALKRDQNLQDVPAAISVFDAVDLERYEIDSIRDITRLTPNVLGSTFTNNQPTYAIRGGANTLSAVGANKPVAFYIDEVYIPRQGAGDVELFDLEKVEVLRGPQGTFFGRNVAAGAIILTTEKPSLSETALRGQVAFGNYNATEVRGLVSGPLSDTVAGKVSVSYAAHDGYGRDEISGDDQDDLESLTYRGSLLFAPNDRFEAILSADLTSDRNGGRTLAADDFGSDDPRVSTLGIDQDFERKIYGGSLRATYKVESGELVSITGIRGAEMTEFFAWVALDFEQLPFAFQRIALDTEEPTSFQQELRFVSDETSRFNYITGVFYLNEDNNRIVDRQDLAAGTGVPIRDQLFDQNITTDAFAAYFDGTYALTDKFDISAGLRYTVETRKASLNFVNQTNTAQNFTVSGLEEDFDAWTPRLALTYRPNEDVTLFGTVSRGFTAGGFNTEADALNEITTPFQEETITSYEIGAKTFLAGGRGSFNVTAFYQKYEDKQEFVFNPETFVGTILNAADATIQGIELEAGWDLNDYVSINANYGYLDTEFDSFPIGSSTGNTGNELGNSPNQQFAATIDAAYPFASGAELFFNSSYSWTDEYFTGATNDPDLFVESYGLLGANFGYETDGGRWRFEIYGSNLTDEEFVRIPSDFIVTAKHLGEPRTYGVRLTASY